MTAPIYLRRRGSNEEVCAVAVVRQVAAEAGDAGAIVGAVFCMQLHRAVPAQECGLGVVICENLQPALPSWSVRTGGSFVGPPEHHAQAMVMLPSYY